MRNQLTIQERLEQKVFCFGGDAEGDNGAGGGDDPTRTPGENTRIDSRGNRVNFNVGPATVDNTPNFTRTLPNGVVVEDFSRPFQGQVNLSGQATPASTGTTRSDLGAVATGLNSLNTPAPSNNIFSNLSNINMPVTAQGAIQEALETGRLNLGGGFYAGQTPTGFGLGFERRFAEGGAVTSGIASLGLPQTMFKSTNS